MNFTLSVDWSTIDETMGVKVVHKSGDEYNISENDYNDILT